MATNEDFTDIRPYTDKEIPTVMARLSKNKYLISSLRSLILPKCRKLLCYPVDFFIGLFLRLKLNKIKTVKDFQIKISIKKLMPVVINKTIDNLTSTGLENLDKSKPYLFISNHRDIVLDSALLNCLIFEHGFTPAQIAFGDNLLINDTVIDLIRANKSFIVKRDLPLREQIKASIHLSKYIESTLHDGDSIWLAQRAGRAKDGNDITNPSIIKMLYLSQRKIGMEFSDYINSCRIVPVSISYEYDPCDRLKAWELYRTEKKRKTSKTKKEDLISIFTGIKGKKGRVHFSFGNILKGNFGDDKDVAYEIDKEIHKNYKLWPSNYIAYDLITKTKKYNNMYTVKDFDLFIKRYKNLFPNIKSWIFKTYAKSVCNMELLQKNH